MSRTKIKKEKEQSVNTHCQLKMNEALLELYIKHIEKDYPSFFNKPQIQ
jgi:hypothetical protein